MNIVPEDRPIKPAANTAIIAALALLALGACNPAQPPGGGGAAGARPPAGDGAGAYRPPPTVTGLAPDGIRRVTLAGRADPGARVRLATPAGRETFARAGDDGVWRLDLDTPTAPRLFGLSTVEPRRVVQSEGYLVITPDPLAAQLRSGAGARVIGDGGPGPRIEAVDFDSKGGAVVSGRASPRVALDLWVDGARRGHGQATDDGHFYLALDEPLSFAGHRVEVGDGPRRASASLRLSRAAPLIRGPYRTEKTPSGWRIDWMTPGGGLQTTLLITNDGGHA